MAFEAWPIEKIKAWSFAAPTVNEALRAMMIWLEGEVGEPTVLGITVDYGDSVTVAIIVEE